MLDPGADKRGVMVGAGSGGGGESGGAGVGRRVRAAGRWGNRHHARVSPAQIEFGIGHGPVTYAWAGRIEVDEWVDLSVKGECTTQGHAAAYQVALYPSPLLEMIGSGGRGERFFAPTCPDLRDPVYSPPHGGATHASPLLSVNAAFSGSLPPLDLSAPSGRPRGLEGEDWEGANQKRSVSAALFAGTGGVEAASNAATGPEFLTGVLRSIELSCIKA